MDSSYCDISDGVTMGIEKFTNKTFAANIDSQDHPSAAAYDTPMAAPPNSSCSGTARELTAERTKWIEKNLMNAEYRPYSTSARDECNKKQSSPNNIAIERRRWVERLLLNAGDYKPYDTAAREELRKQQNIKELTSERKRWIESTLLSPGGGDFRSVGWMRDSQDSHALPQASPSVAERREWLSGVANAKSAAELEHEVRLEMRMKEEARVKKEGETMMAEGGKEAGQSTISGEEAMADEQNQTERKENNESAAKVRPETRTKEEASKMEAKEEAKTSEKAKEVLQARIANEEAMAGEQNHSERKENLKELAVVASKQEAIQLNKSGKFAKKEEDPGEIVLEEESVAQHPLKNTKVSKKTLSVHANQSPHEEMGPTCGKKMKKQLLKGLVKRFAPKRRW